MFSLVSFGAYGSNRPQAKECLAVHVLLKEKNINSGNWILMMLSVLAFVHVIILCNQWIAIAKHAAT